MQIQKWEYMFVRHHDGKIMAIDDAEYTNPKEQFVWRDWLKQRGLEGWELVSEFTLNASKSVHATLKRPINS